MNSDALGPLVNAATVGDLDSLKHLLAAQGPSQPDEAAAEKLLTTAAWERQEAVFTFLLSEYPPRSVPEEAVRAAVYSGSIPIFSALLARDPALVNLQFDKRGTPLAVACSSRQSPEFLEFLLAAGADPNQDPEMAALPLAAVAAFYRDTRAADLLLSHGARLQGSGALQTAASLGSEVMLRYLLERGAGREIAEGGIPAAAMALHGAARRGRAGNVRVLLEYGVDVDIRNGEGQKALELAEEAEKVEGGGEGFSEVKDLLSTKVPQI